MLYREPEGPEPNADLPFGCLTVSKTSAWLLRGRAVGMHRRRGCSVSVPQEPSHPCVCVQVCVSLLTAKAPETLNQQSTEIWLFVSWASRVPPLGVVPDPASVCDGRGMVSCVHCSPRRTSRSLAELQLCLLLPAHPKPCFGEEKCALPILSLSFLVVSPA